MVNPIYRQIAEDLREQIESGELQPGQQLQTELELRKRYGASRNTVRDAIKWLMNLGLVETRPGQGTFVVEKFDPFVSTLSGDPGTGDGVIYQFQVSKHGRTPSSSPVQVETQKAGAEVAAELQLPEGTAVISRHEKRFIDDTPWSMQTSFYPRGLAVQGADRLSLPDNIQEGAVLYLAETLGLKQVGYRDWITVRAPDALERTSSSCRRMAGLECSRSSGRPSTRLGHQCESRSPCSRLTGTSSSLKPGTYRSPRASRTWKTKSPSFTLTAR